MIAPFNSSHSGHGLEKIDSLQVGRGLAALAVVVHHADLAAANFIGGQPAFVSAALGLGYLGVDFFFVLSGFIIYYSATRKPREQGARKRFLIDRAIRIYAPYLPIGVLMALLYTVLPDVSAGGRDWGWFTTLTLLPSELPPALSVAWTLRHEIIFYLIFALVFYSGRLLAGMGIWLLLIIGSWITGLTPQVPALSPIVGLINIEFAFGLGVALLVLNGVRISAVLVLLAAVACLTAWFWLGADRSLSVFVGAALACVVLVAVQAELDHKLKAPRWLVFLGDSSYALYLIHPIVIAVSVRAIMKVDGLSNYFVAVVILCVVSVVASAAYHLAVERPALRLLGRLRQRPAGADLGMTRAVARREAR